MICYSLGLQVCNLSHYGFLFHTSRLHSLEPQTAFRGHCCFKRSMEMPWMRSKTHGPQPTRRLWCFALSTSSYKILPHADSLLLELPLASLKHTNICCSVCVVICYFFTLWVTAVSVCHRIAFIFWQHSPSQLNKSPAFPKPVFICWLKINLGCRLLELLCNYFKHSSSHELPSIAS